MHDCTTFERYPSVVYEDVHPSVLLFEVSSSGGDALLVVDVQLVELCLQPFGGQRLHRFLTTAAGGRGEKEEILMRNGCAGSSARCSQVSYLHVSGGDVDVSLVLLAERSDDGQADALVAARYHGDFDRHVCSQGRNENA